MNKRAELASAAGAAPAGIAFEALSEGMSASYTRTVTEADIETFAQVSGDDNPVHLDAAYAAATPFKGRIAHGMLSASYISTVIGTRLPGPGTIYLSQSLHFVEPVRIGDAVEARITVTEIQPERRRAVLETVCRVGDKVVIEGEALVMVPAGGGRNPARS